MDGLSALPWMAAGVKVPYLELGISGWPVTFLTNPEIPADARLGGWLRAASAIETTGSGIVVVAGAFGIGRHRPEIHCDRLFLTVAKNAQVQFASRRLRPCSQHQGSAVDVFAVDTDDHIVASNTRFIRRTIRHDFGDQSSLPCLDIE